MKIKLLFHYISYLQYLMMLIAILFMGRGYWLLIQEKDVSGMMTDMNSTLIFMGVAISFSTLQDPTKTQNKFSKRIYEDPRKGRVFIGFMAVMAGLFLVLGISGYLSSEDKLLSEISFGILAIGIGFIGLLKVAMEMFENHRLDRKKG